MKQNNICIIGIPEGKEEEEGIENLFEKVMMVRPLWKTIWNFLRKLNMELPFDPAIPLLGLYPKNPETPIQKNLCTPMFIAVQFTIAKCWKQPMCPSVNECIEKLWYIYTMECYSAERRSSYPLRQHG